MNDMVLRFDCTKRQVRDALMGAYSEGLAAEGIEGKLLNMHSFDVPGWYSFAVCIDDMIDSAIALDFMSSYRENEIFKTSCIKTA